MTDARMHVDTHGTILYDAEVVSQINHAWFDPSEWERQGRLLGRGGGRAAASFIDSPAGPCVLRHYHRGGMVADLLGDRYLWTGREQVRSVAEFRLLQEMAEKGLPVPVPLAARYCRRGMHYTADILMRRIDHAKTLAEHVSDDLPDAGLIEHCGALVARFHRCGVWHADLNAHNILITPEGSYVIDFDRGQWRTPARSWQESNLRRLRRSLMKLGADRDGEPAFEQQWWNPLMRGYAQAMEAS